MKKIYIFFIVFIIAFINMAFAVEKPKLYIEDAIKYENTDNVTVNVYMENNNSNLVTLGFDLKYDASKLKFISSKSGKDLNATMKLAEDIPEDSKISVGILSLNGAKNDGLYYSFTFEVLDAKKNIPLELILKEAVNNKGDDVSIELQNGEIKISKAQTEVMNLTSHEQKIAEFQKTDIDELETLESIISQNGNIEILENDTITYEIEYLDILEILEDGTMIANKEGSTRVKVKLNGEVIGNVLVEVKDGKVMNVSWIDENIEFATEGSIKPLNKVVQNEEEFYYKGVPESSGVKHESSNINANIIMIGIALIIILGVVIFYFKKRKDK